MKVKSLFALSATIAVSMVLAIAYILLPEKVWSPTSIGSLILFSFAVGFSFYAPFCLPEGKGGDAATLASVGSMAFTVPSLLGLSAAAFVLALTGSERPVWAVMVVTVAGFAISGALLHATAQLVGNAASSALGPSNRTLWHAQIETLKSLNKDFGQRSALEAFLEKIQYAASEASGKELSVNTQIQEAIDRLGPPPASGAYAAEAFSEQIGHLTYLLELREQELKSIRSKA